jgi:hypothetical protein
MKVRLIMKFAKLLLALTALGAGFSAQAESDINTGAAAGLSAVAKLDFRIVVPRMIFLRVGTGVNFADALGGANIDRVDFNLTAADIGSATAVAGAAGQGPYPVAVRVLGNGGNISLTALGTAGGLSNGVQTIAWTEIAPTSSNAAGLPHPAIGNGVAGAVTSLPATAGVVNQTANWSFSYNNTNAMAAGTYNGQVVYTAALP